MSEVTLKFELIDYIRHLQWEKLLIIIVAKGTEPVLKPLITKLGETTTLITYFPAPQSVDKTYLELDILPPPDTNYTQVAQTPSNRFEFRHPRFAPPEIQIHDNGLVTYEWIIELEVKFPLRYRKLFANFVKNSRPVYRVRFFYFDETWKEVSSHKVFNILNGNDGYKRYNKKRKDNEEEEFDIDAPNDDNNAFSMSSSSPSTSTNILNSNERSISSLSNSARYGRASPNNRQFSVLNFQNSSLQLRTQKKTHRSFVETPSLSKDDTDTRNPATDTMRRTFPQIHSSSADESRISSNSERIRQFRSESPNNHVSAESSDSVMEDGIDISALSLRSASPSPSPPASPHGFTAPLPTRRSRMTPPTSGRHLSPTLPRRASPTLPRRGSPTRSPTLPRRSSSFSSTTVVANPINTPTSPHHNFKRQNRPKSVSASYASARTTVTSSGSPASPNPSNSPQSVELADEEEFVRVLCRDGNSEYNRGDMPDSNRTLCENDYLEVKARSSPEILIRNCDVVENYNHNQHHSHFNQFGKPQLQQNMSSNNPYINVNTQFTRKFNTYTNQPIQQRRFNPYVGQYNQQQQQQQHQHTQQFKIQQQSHQQQPQQINHQQVQFTHPHRLQLSQINQMQQQSPQKSPHQQSPHPQSPHQQSPQQSPHQPSSSQQSPQQLKRNQQILIPQMKHQSTQHMNYNSYNNYNRQSAESVQFSRQTNQISVDTFYNQQHGTSFDQFGNRIMSFDHENQMVPLNDQEFLFGDDPYDVDPTYDRQMDSSHTRQLDRAFDGWVNKQLDPPTNQIIDRQADIAVSQNFDHPINDYKVDNQMKNPTNPQMNNHVTYHAHHQMNQNNRQMNYQMGYKQGNYMNNNQMANNIRTQQQQQIPTQMNPHVTQMNNVKISPNSHTQTQVHYHSQSHPFEMENPNLEYHQNAINNSSGGASSNRFNNSLNNQISVSYEYPLSDGSWEPGQDNYQINNTGASNINDHMNNFNSNSNFYCYNNLQQESIEYVKHRFQYQFPIQQQIPQQIPQQQIPQQQIPQQPQFQQSQFQHAQNIVAQEEMYEYEPEPGAETIPEDLLHLQ